MEMTFNRNIVYSDRNERHYLYLGTDTIKSDEGKVIQEFVHFAEIINVEKDIIIDKHARLIFYGTLLEISRNDTKLKEFTEYKKLPSHIGKYHFNEVKLVKVDTT